MILPRRYLLRRGLAATFLLPGMAEAKKKLAHHLPAAKPGSSAAKAPLPLVVIDPGHGGKDPGAIGVTGIYEKHVSLATAELLAHLLTASGQYRVAMTRSQDVFIPLEHRVDFAQSRKADLFVSLHADALPDPGVRGASVYTLSDQASDRQTAAIAMSENSADRFLGADFRKEPPMVADILTSLLEKETRTGSARMAQSVVRHLGQQLPLLPNPSRHARFMVLRAADIPSVLVEMGFMSNPKDEALLHRADHRKTVALAMKSAVDSYFAVAHAMTGLSG